MKTKIREFNISEDVRVSATLGYVINPGCDPSPVDHGEQPSAEIQSVVVNWVAVHVPGLNESIEIHAYTTNQRRKKIAKWILMQGDIIEDLQRGLMEDHNATSD